MIRDGDLNHEIPGIGRDPEALAHYLDGWHGQMTHTDVKTGNPVAYDHEKEVLVVHATGNLHAHIKPIDEFRTGTVPDGGGGRLPRYVPLSRGGT